MTVKEFINLALKTDTGLIERGPIHGNVAKQIRKPRPSNGKGIEVKRAMSDEQILKLLESKL